jgi:hypothetical protein
MKTAQDVVAFLLASVGGGAQDGEHQVVRQAVIHGVREVLQSKDWLWHTKTNTFDVLNLSTNANYIVEGGYSITVDSVVGMHVGRIIQCGGIFDDPCRIKSIDATSNVITVDRPAKSSVVSGSPVPLRMQTFYDLPANAKDIDTLITRTVGTLHCYISPQEWQQLEVNTRGTGEPYYYTVMRSDSNPECYQIRFVGIPTNGTTVHYTYRYTPKELKYLGYERSCRAGVVANTGSSVTGTGTDFQPDVVGSVIRFGTIGTEADPVGSLAPFVRESRIKGWNNATSITIEDSFPNMERVKYAITDPIDASPQMYTAVLSAAEMWYARMSGKPSDVAMNAYGRDLRLAMESDSVAPFSGRARGHYPTPRSMGWHSDLRSDVG